MKLASVVCRVVADDGTEKLANIVPAEFLDMLSAATEQQEAEPEDDLAALQAELDASRKNPGQAAAPVPAERPKTSNGMVVIPRAAVNPLIAAKTRGELIEKLDELLSQFNARVAKEGE